MKSQLTKTSNHVTFLMKCQASNIVPKDLALNEPYQSHRSAKISLRASKALLRERIRSYRFKLVRRQRLALSIGPTE
jgi:hypothetical protein